jgi:DNA-3-methyladenine glycosylase II
VATIQIPVPGEFNFDLCLQFLRRNPKEILHRVEESKVTKVIRVDNRPVLISLEPSDGGLALTIHENDFPHHSRVIAYVREWFDLDSDLVPFYKLVRKDELLGPLVRKFRGQRIMSHPDLFESLIWAVLGQQINLGFAYTLKQRFVETFGEQVQVEGQTYFLFPSPERVALIEEPELMPLQFSRQKASYTINIAKAFVNGALSKQMLLGKPLAEARELLMKIKGVGNWTANYALMRTFRYPDAFPLEDAGLHNALKNLMGLRKKPGLKRVKTIFRKYKGWEAYATVYLWKSL